MNLHKNNKDTRRKIHTTYIKIRTDGYKKDGKIKCAVITPQTKIRRRPPPWNMVYSAEQEAVIKAMRVSK
jgi:hypothetical protein